MQISVLASGSKGNCTYIEGKTGALLIDNGRSAKEILGTKRGGGRLEAAGGRTSLINGILVTHEHADHIKGITATGNKLGCSVFGTAGTLDGYKRTVERPLKFELCPINPGESFEVSGIKITAFNVSHDAMEPCGYLLEEDGTKLCYCTDTGVVTESMMKYLSQSDGIVLESNHCPDMLKNGPYPAFLKRRIASAKGHLSNRDAGCVLKEISDKVSLVILAHLSEENNNPDLALRQAQESLGLNFDDVTLFAASSIDGITSVIKKPKTKRLACDKRCWEYKFEI